MELSYHPLTLKMVCEILIILNNKIQYKFEKDKRKSKMLIEY